ncbi:SpoIIE family protein phosphatase, partial [Streptomyces sp. NPDC057052]|uniref:SpoIIE family protein phosphatase n=1 Tax=Streptomyces sp. NPDC057052 TaxID=3346010 RepID=UPI00363814E8
AHGAVFYAWAHDPAAGRPANPAVAPCRPPPRPGAGRGGAGAAVEAALLEQFHRSRYATGILADLDLVSGTPRWVNHGHPPPVLIRGGRRATTPACPPTHPLGTDLGLAATVCKEQREPGVRRPRE